MQLLKLKSSLWPFIREAEEDKEDFKDVPLEDDACALSQPKEESDDLSESREDTRTIYLPKARNPLYCKAEYSCLWELVMVSDNSFTETLPHNFVLSCQLTQHYHPSVQAFAKRLTEVGACRVHRYNNNPGYHTVRENT